MRQQLKTIYALSLLNMQAKNLQIGQSCEFPTLEETMRNGVCLRQSYSGVYMSFEEKKYPDSQWVRVREHIGHTVEVEPTEKDFAEITTNKFGESVIEGEVFEKKGRGRGRKKIEINFPKGKFTIVQVAEQNNVSTTCIYLKVQQKIGLGEIKIVDEKKGGRGKPTKIYKVIK